MRKFLLMLILLGVSKFSFGQLSLEMVVRNYEEENDTILPPCFLARLDSIYRFVGSPTIKIDSKGSRFFPGRVFIKDSCALFYLVEELAHSYQWEKQKGGKFRMTVALGGLVLKAGWRSIFHKAPDDSTSNRGRVWQHYSSFAYEPMRNSFWAFEYEAHDVIAKDMWRYLGEPCKPKKE